MIRWKTDEEHLISSGNNYFNKSRTSFPQRCTTEAEQHNPWDQRWSWKPVVFSLQCWNWALRSARERWKNVCCLNCLWCFLKWNGWCTALDMEAKDEICYQSISKLFSISSWEMYQEQKIKIKKKPISLLIRNDMSFASEPFFMLRNKPIRLCSVFFLSFRVYLARARVYSFQPNSFCSWSSVLFVWSKFKHTGALRHYFIICFALLVCQQHTETNLCLLLVWKEPTVSAVQLSISSILCDRSTNPSTILPPMNWHQLHSFDERRHHCFCTCIHPHFNVYLDVEHLGLCSHQWLMAINPTFSCCYNHKICWKEPCGLDFHTNVLGGLLFVQAIQLHRKQCS